MPTLVPPDALGASIEQPVPVNAALVTPVERIATDPPLEPPRKGMALCLSGGGYRAMLFHLGTCWRLNEAGLLRRLSRISSVSGGSIPAALIGLKWARLRFGTDGVGQRFAEEVAEPLHGLASRTIDVRAIASGVLLPGTISERVEASYRRYLYGDATLQDLPDWPHFVMNASNVQSGALWRFQKRHMADYRVGLIPNPTLPLAKAVAASSAFPPLLSPARLSIDEKDYKSDASPPPLHRPPFTTRVVLTDGGVYDNLGLETAWKKFDTVLVSDAGAGFKPEGEPKTDWARHGFRVVGLIDNQVRALRKRQVVNSFTLRRRMLDKGTGPDDLLLRVVGRDGAYWSIRGVLKGYPDGEALHCPEEATRALANIPTRLKELDRATQERLVNWGYAACDARLRRYVDTDLPAGHFPYPRGVTD
jgi:NTE family protein